MSESLVESLINILLSIPGVLFAFTLKTHHEPACSH